tara:strand:- start:459 stop:875 length:417 start_codon:yes stop_codon:yes gene_type:complete
MDKTQITRAEIKEVKELVDDWREAVTSMSEDESDFEVDNYRFILKCDIDEVMTDELSSDTYTLGCFNAHFIADIIGLSCEVIEKAQESESFELLGELMIKDIEEVQSAYVSSEGYGHHFGHYDCNEIELTDYYVFRIN